MRNDRTARYSLPIMAGLICTATVLTAQAEWKQQTSTYQFSISGMSLDAALRKYARITGRQIVYRTETVGERPAPVLIGTYDADTALAALLKGVPVRVEHVRPGVIVLSPLPAITAGPPESRQSAALEQGGDHPDLSSDPIVVTGTIIRGSAPAGASVTTIDRRAIDRSTRATVADIVALLPQNSGGAGSDAAVLGGVDRTSLNSTLASSPNLRGLGSDATLTLVNGRRQAGSGGRGDFSDLSAIPLAAVDRIEVLKDGASAIYGSDAIGGVVNVILKRDYSGADTKFRVGAGTAGSPANYQVSQLAGLTWEGGGLLAGYEFDHRGALAAAERRSTRSADLRSLGGSDWRSYYSSPGTILRFDATARAYVPAFAIPSSTDRPVRGDFTPGRNRENQFALSDTLPLQERHAVYLTGNHNILPGVEVFIEGRWARRHFEYALPPATATFAVTPSNPFFVSPDGSPFSVIAYSFGDDLGAARAKGWVDAASLTGGVTADLGRGWQLDTYYLQSRERSGEQTGNSLNTSALSEALGASPDNPATPFSTSREGYFNPYGSGLSNREAVLRFIGSGSSSSQRRSALATAVAKLDGPLLRMPAGSLRVALGGAWRGETLESGGWNLDTGIAPTQLVRAYAHREIKALFGELSLPVLDQDEGFGIGRLQVSAALRREEYSDFGSTTNPKIGATWRLTKAVELRGSWGTSFRAPSLPEIHAAFRVAPTQLQTAAGSLVPVLVMSGGNPDLHPETADTVTAGISLRPIPRVRVDFGYFRTKFDDRIERPVLQSAVRALLDQSLSPFVTPLDPVINPSDLARVRALLADPGAIDAGILPPTAYRAIVDGRYVNTARVHVEGIDAEIGGSAPLGGGTVSGNINASYLFRYAQQLTTAASVMELASTIGYPAKFKMRSSVDWSGGTFGATLSSSFVGAYRDIDSTPERQVRSWLTFDLQLRTTPPGAKGFSLALDARNLLNRAPPFVNRSNGIGYDAANSDILGRVVSIQLSKTF